MKRFLEGTMQVYYDKLKNPKLSKRERELMEESITNLQFIYVKFNLITDTILNKLWDKEAVDTFIRYPDKALSDNGAKSWEEYIKVGNVNNYHIFDCYKEERQEEMLKRKSL